MNDNLALATSLAQLRADASKTILDLVIDITSTAAAAERKMAVARILKGVIDWIQDESTIEAGMVEDLARCIERCADREELRDLSVHVRRLMLGFQPDAGRVAPTQDEARILHVLDLTTGS